MPTEEDLKAIVVHKKYSSSRKSKSENRKRKRSTSSGSSNTSISSPNERKPDKPENKDAGFIPSRFLKDKHQSSSRRRDEETSYPGYKDTRDRREDRRDERREDRSRVERSRDERSRDERSRDERSRDERSRDERKDDRDRSRHYEEDDRRRERDHETTRSRDDRNDDQSRSSKYDHKSSNSSSFHRNNKDHDFYKPPRKGDDFDLRRKTKDENKRAPSQDDKRKNRRGEEDEDYDPISDEELAMLEEDAGILEIYRELEREMRSKRYTAYLGDIDFSAVEVLKCKAKEIESEDAISRLIKCGFSSNYGGKVLTEKIKALAIQKGVEAPLYGAFSANKKSVRSVFQETLSPNIALSSNTDLLLRQRLAQLARGSNERELILTDEPVNNTLLSDSVRMFNQLAGTNLDVK